MKNIILIFNMTLILFLFLMAPSNISNARQGVDCEYVGSSHGCDVYDCGRCIMWACGSSGGMLDCGHEN